MAQALPAGSRKPYSGSYRSLVVAIDVGTTFSGVSYAILEPGEIPKIHGVTRFPGQEHVAGNTKIPSIIYYDKQGRVMAAGAEADAATIISQAEDEGWSKVELFKLRLRPRTMRLNMNGMRFSPLPKKKTPVHVFGDFLAYLYHCTKKFITDTHANGAALWGTVEDTIQFVLSHPNGWEGPQQSKMRRAAIYGGLIPDTNVGKARIWFVTEGEASLHACVLSGLAADVLSSPSQHGFLIADAGGGTLDISSYGIKATSPLVIEEIAPPDCIFAGSVFVSRRAREFLEDKLKNSKYGTPDALDHITKKFDETTKRLFRDKKDLQFIPFGSPLDKDPAVGIRSGQLKLTGQEVANLFEPSVEAAVYAIKAQIDASRGMIKSIFLVGGYAASPWLFSQLKERLARYGVSVSRPDSQTSKAVADGAIGFFCDHHVSARMSKFMYGVEYLREFDQNNEDHVARCDRLCELPSGPKLLPDAFDCILARSVQVKESTVFTRKYSTELTSLSLLSVFEVEIWCFRGGNEIPTWIDRNSEVFSTLCIVQADLSLLSGSAEPKVGRNGKQYWTIVFSVEIHFGLTEFKARMKWVDNGSTRYGPASIVYNEHGHRAVDDDEPDVYPEDDHSVGGGGTPRSERLRSLPASRARSPTEPHHPASPGSYDGNSLYGGEAASIRGIPPPSVAPHPHELSRDRALSKPATPKATSPVPQQIERELSIESRRGSVHSRGRERTTSAKSSRTDSVSGAKLSEALSAVWGAGDPQLRSPIQPQPPQSPQAPTPQTPQPPQQPTPKPPSQPFTQPPTQPPSQPPSQPHTPKPKSRKPSMTASIARASPQLPPPPVQPEVAAPPPQPSPKPPTPRDVQATVMPSPKPSPKPSAPVSPKSAILPSPRGLSRKTSPPHKAEKPLSPLNPSAQVQPEPVLEPVTRDATKDIIEALGADLLDTNTKVVSGGADAFDTSAQDAWNLGDVNTAWDLGANNSAAMMDSSLAGVPGSFTGGAVEGGASFLDNPVPSTENTVTGAPALFSGSISSFMSSSAVTGIGSKLGSFGFGFGSGGSDTASGAGLFGSNKKQDDIELKSGPGWGSTAKSAAGKALGGNGFGWGGSGKASPWGKGSQSAAGSKAVTPNLPAPQVVESPQGDEKRKSRTVTPNPPATPQVLQQAVEPEKSKSRTVTPNPPATPQAPPQDVELARNAEKPKSKVNTPNPPATPQIQEQTVEMPAEALEQTMEVPEQVGEGGGAEEPAQSIVENALEDVLQGEVPGEEQPADTSEALPEPPAEASAGAEEGNPEDAAVEDDGFSPWPVATKKKKGKKGQTEPPTPITPAVDDTEWTSQAKGKKGKKGKQGPTEPPTPTTPAVEDTEWTSSVKGKKGKKKQGLLETSTPTTPALDDSEWMPTVKGKKKKNKGFSDFFGDTEEADLPAGDGQDDENEGNAEQDAHNVEQPDEAQDTQEGQGDQGLAEVNAEVQGESGPVDKQDGEQEDPQAMLDDLLGESKGPGEEEDEEEQNTSGKKKSKTKKKKKK